MKAHANRQDVTFDYFRSVGYVAHRGDGLNHGARRGLPWGPDARASRKERHEDRGALHFGRTSISPEPPQGRCVSIFHTGPFIEGRHRPL